MLLLLPIKRCESFLHFSTIAYYGWSPAANFAAGKLVLANLLIWHNRLGLNQDCLVVTYLVK
jgi:hypothetical protein